MDFFVFWKIFVPVLLIILSFGPVFITMANISIVYGYKKGFLVAIATLLGNMVYITIGAIMAKEFLAIIPKSVIMIFPLIGACFLFNLSYSFWKKDISKINGVKIDKNFIVFLLKMFLLTLSSPVAIVGYSIVFSTIADSIQTSLCSALIGGYCGAIVGKCIVILGFGTLGKKINKKILSILNKVSSGLLFFYGLLLISKFIKDLIKVVM